MKFNLGEEVIVKGTGKTGIVKGYCEVDNEYLVQVEKGKEISASPEALCSKVIKVSEPDKENAKEGLRYNKGKIDLTQLSPIAQRLESMVFMYGEAKYFKSNWKKFKEVEQVAYDEFLQCAKRHIMAYEEGKWVDGESNQVHLAHAVWNLNRIMDLYYYGTTHMKDGKDLYHQPLRHELPAVPVKKEV